MNASPRHLALRPAGLPYGSAAPHARHVPVLAPSAVFGRGTCWIRLPSSGHCGCWCVKAGLQWAKRTGGGCQPCLLVLTYPAPAYLRIPFVDGACAAYLSGWLVLALGADRQQPGFFLALCGTPPPILESVVLRGWLWLAPLMQLGLHCATALRRPHAHADLDGRQSRCGDRRCRRRRFAD